MLIIKLQYSVSSLLPSEGNTSVIDGKIHHLSTLSHATGLILVLLSIILLSSCERRNTQAWKQMDAAENLMNTKPDSALAILKGIHRSDIKGEESSARFALLKSMALDKNYIDLKTFNVLQPAIDYYLEHGSPDEKFRTYYYQGRIYMNQCKEDSAMLCFMNGCDLRPKVTDSLLLAHTLVAQGSLYFKQYKVDEFIHNNLEAAKLYQAIGKNVFAIKSYTNALDGYILKTDKVAADSLLSICESLVQKYPEGEAYLFSSYLSYTINLCSPKEIKELLSEFQDEKLTSDETMIMAQGYSKIGEYDKALALLSRLSSSKSPLDSLKYTTVKIDILEKQGKYKDAFTLYKDYAVMLEHYQHKLLTQDLLFSDQKHQLEIKNIKEIQKKNWMIGISLCSIIVLVMLVGWAYYRGHLSKTKRILTEKENENLKLEQDNLRKEKEKAELERNKKILEAENLEKDKKRIEAEQRQQELEAANLRLEISQLEGERDHLKQLQKEKSEMAKPIHDIIEDRLNMLNGLLAKEITNNDSYAKSYNEWIETMRNDKKKFMDSTRLAFTALHPMFMKYLEKHGLTVDEINYLCLYAIGLRGKEVGEYIQLKRHYIISHEIRKKLGIDEHETNIGLYVRRLMKDFEQSNQ